MYKSIPRILLIVLLCAATITSTTFAEEEESKPLSISFGSLSTDNDDTGASIAAAFLQSLLDIADTEQGEERIWRSWPNADSSRENIIALTPELDVRLGSEDAFESITGKIKFLYLNMMTEPFDQTIENDLAYSRRGLEMAEAELRKETDPAKQAVLHGEIRHFLEGIAGGETAAAEYAAAVNARIVAGEDRTTISGLYLPDPKKPFHAIPLSFGFETDSEADNIAALVEVGYVPFGPISRLKGFRFEERGYRLGVNPQVGVFLQAGYKFELDDTPEDREGGEIDESEEDPDSALFRVKGELLFETELTNLSIGFIGAGEEGIPVSARVELKGWYDIANGDFYDREVFALVLKLNDNTQLDFRFEHGSGAPNFNEGDQFGTNLTIKF